MITQEELAARTARAKDATVSLAAELGLDVSAAEVVYDAFSVVVDLAPAPVVARVPVVLLGASSERARAAMQQRELDVARWLHGRGVPTVVPSPLVAVRPYRRDGFPITFWEKVEDIVQPDYETTGFDTVGRMAVVAELHAHLREYPGDAPFFAAMDGVLDEAVPRLAALPDILPAADLERARAEWAELSQVIASPEAFEAAFPGATVQVTHGDAPYYNLIETPAGLLYSDYEHVGLSPVEWDLAGTGPEAIAAYDEEAAKRGLRPVDPDALRACERLRDLQVVAVMAVAPELPMLVDGVAPVLDRWRSSAPWTR